MALTLLLDGAGQDKVKPELVNKVNATITAVNELQGGTADQIPKKTDGTDFNFEMSNSVLPASGTANLKVKVVEIGDWDMDTDAQKNVTHGIADFKKIRSAYAIIRDDSDALYTPLDSFNNAGTPVRGHIAVFQSTTLRLDRTASESYDSTNYNATGFNRGWVAITYEG